MREFARRPLFLGAIAFGVGVAAAINSPWLLLAVLGLAAFRSLSLAAIGTACALLGFWMAPQPLSQPRLESSYFTGEGTVISLPRTTATGYYFVTRTNQARFLTLTRGHPDISLGDRIKIMGRVEPLSEYSERYWLDQGVEAQLRVSVQPEVESRGPVWGRWALSIRQSFLRFSSRSLDRDDEQLLDGLCMNYQAEIDTDTQEKLQICGLLHLFSASGANLLLVAAILGVLHRFVPVPRAVYVGGLLFVLLLYVAAAGLTPSAIRAWGMIALALVAYLVRREFDLLSALGATFVVNGVWAPATLLQAGTHFSYAALLGFAWFVDFERIQAAEGHWGRLAWEGMRTNLVAWGFTTPILAYHAYFVTLAGAISTFFASFPAAAASILGFVAWPISWILPGASKFICDALIVPFLSILRILVELFSHPLFFVPIRPFSGWWLALLYGAAAIAWKPAVRRA